MKKLFLALFALAALQLHAGVTDYNYHSAPDAKYIIYYRSDAVKSDTYDAAIRILDPDMVGHRITKVIMPVRAPHAKDIKIWLSKELNLVKGDNGKKRNEPDILSLEATRQGDSVSVALPEPYVITDEGVYVGVTLTVDEFADPEADPMGSILDKNPICVYPTEPHENALFMHNQTSLIKWTPLSLKNNPRVLAMSVLIDGFEDYEVAINSCTRSFIKLGENGSHELTFSNHGSQPISTIDCLYDIGGKMQKKHISFNEPLPNQWRGNNVVTIGIPELAQAKTYWGNLCITSINGQPNHSAQADGQTETQVLVYDKLPERQVFTEEYTGMWCGYCPRGTQTIAKMTEKYGDRFIVAAIHNEDELSIMERASHPSYHVGYPAFINDRIFLDNQMPLSFGEVEPYWNEAGKKIALGQIDVQAYWDDEQRQVLAESKFTMAIDEKYPHYSVAYLLLADGLTGDTYYQQNYYSGDERYRGTDVDEYVDLPGTLTGVTFDHVLIYSPNLKGEPASVPDAITAGVEMTHSVAIDRTQAVSLYGTNLIQDSSKLSVVALLLDNESGAVINCAQCHVMDARPSAINEATSAQKSDTAYYDLQGRRVLQPRQGTIYIKVCEGKATKVKM